MGLVKKAQILATGWHEGQFRKDGATLYITHPEAVVRLLESIGIDNEEILCAGWLHDVVEDCGVTEEVLQKEFGQNITRIVMALTRNIDRDAYKERIKSADYAVQIVKLADLVHNCSNLGSGLPQKTVERKVKDSEELYLGLAKSICPEFYRTLLEYIAPYRTE